MDIELNVLKLEYLKQFKKDMQDAFQQGAIDEFGEMNGQILPELDIDNSLNTEGAIAYGAFIDGNLVGGAIVVIDEKNQYNHLHFLYVKNEFHNKGVGLSIWQTIEKLHPKTKVWETCTPYFEKRNIHFYINKCGFHIVEFYNKWHKDPNDNDDISNEEYFEGMFRFEKERKY